MILDLTSGNRAIWFDKNRNDVIYVDKRFSVHPNIVADSRELPFRDGSFSLIIFDPPHVNGGKKSNISRDYGHHTTHQIKQFVEAAAKEAWRVSANSALLVLKWNDHDQKLPTILALMHPWWAPLVGHKTATRMPRGNSTYWVVCSRGV